MRRWMLLGVVCAACSSGTGANDAATNGDAPSNSGTCGGMTCGAGQLCVHACQATPCNSEGGVACPPPFCFTPPASCGSTPTCNCLISNDPCNADHTFVSLGVCTTITGGVLTCGGCD